MKLNSIAFFCCWIKCTGNCRLLLRLLDPIDYDLHFIELVHWSPIIQWLCSHSHCRCRCCYIHHSSPFHFSLLSFTHYLFVYYIITISTMDLDLRVFFSSFVVKADKIKSHIIFTYIYPTAEASIHAPLNWPISVFFSFQVCSFFRTNA